MPALTGIHATATEMTQVYAGYGGIAGYQLPIWVNKETGISRKYGIDLEPLLISGGALNMQALLAGSIQMSQNSASSAIQAALRGVSVVLAAALENRMQFDTSFENKKSVVELVTFMGHRSDLDPPIRDPQLDRSAEVAARGLARERQAMSF